MVRPPYLLKVDLGMKNVYRLSGIAIWLIGVIFAICAVRCYINSGHQNAYPLAVAFAIFSFASIFSFIYGAQRGHWVRYLTIILTSMFFTVAYLKNANIVATKSFFLLLFAVMIPLVVINLMFGKKFRNEFNAHGIVDYFDVYFVSKQIKRH